MAGRTKLDNRAVQTWQLTDKQRLFVAHYMKTMNAAKAAIAAGYSPNTAATTGGKLLKMGKVARAIGSQMKHNLVAIQFDTETILKELAYQAMRDPIDLCDENGMIITDDLRNLPERIRRCIDSFKIRSRTNPVTGETTQEVELKLTSKLAAIELAMKHFGMLVKNDNDDQKREGIDWDKLYSDDVETPDVIEARIEQTRPRLSAPKSNVIVVEPVENPTFDIVEDSEPGDDDDPS